MNRDMFLTVRLTAKERRALERAALAEDRRHSALARKVLVDWLRVNGWLEDDPDDSADPRVPEVPDPD